MSSGEHSTAGFEAHIEVGDLAHDHLLSWVHSVAEVLGHSADNTLERSYQASMAVASTSVNVDLDRLRRTSTDDCAHYACALGVWSRYESVVSHSSNGRLHLQSSL